MPDGRLIIGTKRYSSWSLRGWLAVHMAGLDVAEVVIPLNSAGAFGTPGIAAASPNGLVPCLEHQGAQVWESMAIAEYCAEVKPSLWPADRVTRAHARSLANEMHAGFGGLRRAMFFNAGRSFPGRGQTPEAMADLAHLERAWGASLGRYRGPFLFGAAFTLADAMFAPVCSRLRTWAPDLSPQAQGYVNAVLAHPLLVRWYGEALAEPLEWQLDKYENPA
jgi:glutathione S-transferase